MESTPSSNLDFVEIVTILDLFLVLDFLTSVDDFKFFSEDFRIFPVPLSDFSKTIPLPLLAMFLTVSACFEESSEKLPVTGIPAFRILASNSFEGIFNSFASSNTLISSVMKSLAFLTQF